VKATPDSPLTDGSTVRAAVPLRPVPQNHRTVDRVTRILEEVVYNPGLTFAELARALDAPKSSVHGFMSGLLATGWLYEQNRRLYLGPAVYGLTLASGHIRAGLVTFADLTGLHQETQLAVFLGVLAGDDLIYISEVGSDPVAGFDARSNIRRDPLATAGGKALLAVRADAEREGYLRRRNSHDTELVGRFLEEYADIRGTRIATNVRQSGRRYALATAVHSPSREAVASVTVVGRTNDVQPRVEELSRVLLQHVDSWEQRSLTPREAI
jgi:DNA-binding IclR family transcriptional regulator